MKNIKFLYSTFLLIFLMIISNKLLAQPYIIKSKEGYTNIRIAPNANAEIKAKLKNHTVILIDQTEELPSEQSNWRKVLFYKDKPFSFLVYEENLEMDHGYVHKSQLKNLEDLQKVNEETFKITYTLESFSASKYKVSYYDNGNTNVKSINNIYYYLADCGLPKKAISKAEVKVNKQQIEIPGKYLLGIFSASDNFQYYKDGNVYYASQQIGDGACTNYVVWVVENQKLTQRFVGWDY